MSTCCKVVVKGVAFSSVIIFLQLLTPLSNSQESKPTIEVTKNIACQEKLPLKYTVVSLKSAIMINYTFSHYCGRTHFASVDIEGSLLNVRMTSNNAITGCTCVYDMQMIIRNLKPGSYTLRLWQDDIFSETSKIRKKRIVKVIQ
jgi:hypothetical protein